MCTSSCKAGGGRHDEGASSDSQQRSACLPQVTEYTHPPGTGVKVPQCHRILVRCGKEEALPFLTSTPPLHPSSSTSQGRIVCTEEWVPV
ncbi:hypothetical protein E2C01_080007 [Portunus trituberculatus]|uniref:Uncharacterized protein n=1 Tax=Portunus trituberculatus TaxID=210409 RepID=A0A5B7IMZ8_PORTR|nr:hypothetical protein [Portunus trituberculatus]